VALYLQGIAPWGRGSQGRGMEHPPPLSRRVTEDVFPCEQSINPRLPASSRGLPPCLLLSPGTSFQHPSFQRDVIKPGGTATGLMTSGCRAEQHHSIHLYIFTHMSTK